MKIIDYFPVKQQKDREVGIEIEMEGDRLFPPNGLNYWNVTGDGSLRGNPDAAEYVLKNPTKRNLVQARLRYLSEQLAKRKAILSPSDRCGVHIHLNCQNMEMADFFKLATMYFLFENVLTRWCGEDREGNLFCLRATDAEYLIQAMVEAKIEGTLRDVTTNSLRYSAINFAALRKYGSVEFRAMRTPEDFNQIHTWVQLLLRIKDQAVAAKSEAEIIENVSKLGPERYARRVFGKLFPQVMTDDINMLILQGMDVAQHLAYVPVNPKLLAKAPRKKSPLENPFSDPLGRALEEVGDLGRRQRGRLDPRDSDVERDAPVWASRSVPQPLRASPSDTTITSNTVNTMTTVNRTN